MLEPGHAGDAFGYLSLRRSGRPKPTQVAFYIRSEDCDPGVTELLSQTLQGHCFASSRRARNQPMAIDQPKRMGTGFAGSLNTQHEAMIACHKVASTVGSDDRTPAVIFNRRQASPRQVSRWQARNAPTAPQRRGNRYRAPA